VQVAGSIQKWTVRGNDKHPFHLHVNSYQLQGVTGDSSGFFVEGDWHDVMFPPLGVQITSYMFPVDSFVTKSVIHCHFLPHEDLGCMGFIRHTGTEGATTGLTGHALSCTTASTGSLIYYTNCSSTGRKTATDDDATPAKKDKDDDRTALDPEIIIVIAVVGAVVAIGGAGGLLYCCLFSGSGAAKKVGTELV
jgi:hypothetical protein